MEVEATRRRGPSAAPAHASLAQPTYRYRYKYSYRLQVPGLTDRAPLSLALPCTSNKSKSKSKSGTLAGIAIARNRMPIGPDSRLDPTPASPAFHSSLAYLLACFHSHFPLLLFRSSSFFVVPPTHVPFSSLRRSLSLTETKRSGLQVSQSGSVRAGRLCFRNPAQPSINPAPAAPKGDSCAIRGASSQSCRRSWPCEDLHPPFSPSPGSLAQLTSATSAPCYKCAQPSLVPPHSL